MTVEGSARVVWRRSTRTGPGNGGGGNCVEVGALPDLTRVNWRKSTRTGGANGDGGNCVEVGVAPHTALSAIGIRDSKSPDTDPLWLTTLDFTGLTTAIRDDRFS